MRHETGQLFTAADDGRAACPHCGGWLLYAVDVTYSAVPTVAEDGTLTVSHEDYQQEHSHPRLWCGLCQAVTPVPHNLVREI